MAEPFCLKFKEKFYGYDPWNIKNGKRNIVFIRLNPARNGSPLAVYKQRAKAKEPLEKNRC